VGIALRGSAAANQRAGDDKNSELHEAATFTANTR